MKDLFTVVEVTSYQDRVLIVQKGRYDPKPFETHDVGQALAKAVELNAISTPTQCYIACRLVPLTEMPVGIT